MPQAVPRRLTFTQPDPATSTDKTLPAKAPQKPAAARECCVRYAAQINQKRLARKAKEAAELEAKKRAGKDRGRLPNGAIYDAKYDHTVMRWTGTLTVNVLGEIRVFKDNRRGVFALMGCLDTQFRKALAAAQVLVVVGAGGTGEIGGGE